LASKIKKQLDVNTMILATLP